MVVVAYLVNQYPAPSHTFIRREIKALEASGHTVHRFSHRSSEARLVDSLDLTEQSMTEVLSTASPLCVALGMLRLAASHPVRFVRTVSLALRMGVRSGPARMGKHLGYLGLACVLTDRIMRLQISHVHAHMATNAAAVAMLCHEASGIPYSFTAHFGDELAEPRRQSLRDKVERAAFVAVVSSNGHAVLSRLFPDHSSKLRLVPCGLDLHLFDSRSTTRPDSRQFVSVARIDDQKDPLLLIRAAAILREQEIPLRLVLVGDGPLRGAVEAAVTQLGLSACVRLVGWQSQAQVLGHLEASRALVLASRSEGLPVAIMEAFAMRRPAIATDVGGVGELVTTGETGWLVAPGDAEVLAAAMRKCLETEPVELQRLAEAGRMRVLERHDIRRSAALLANLFSGDSTS